MTFRIVRSFILLGALLSTGCTNGGLASDPANGPLGPNGPGGGGGGGTGGENQPSVEGPKGKLLWESSAWSNGNARHIDGHGEYDPDDDQLEVAAGEGRLLTINGDGTAKLDGNRSRIYLHAPHRNAQLTFEANATDTALENISTKLRSRHNEGGSPANRFGGYGVAFQYKEGVSDFKIEPYHNEHESGTKHPLPRALEYNRWYGFRVRIEAAGGDTKALVTAFVDYDLNGNWTEVGQEEYARTGFLLNDLNALYSWIRANSGDAVQQGLLLRNARFEELTPSP
jgi:hypothetical protein